MHGMTKRLFTAAAALIVGAWALPAPAQLPKTEFENRLEASKKKAVDWLLAQQKTQVRIFTGANGANVVDVDAEWKDVVVVKGTATIKVKGKEYNDVYAVLPGGWFAPEPAAAGQHYVQNIGGVTSLATVALLAAGVNPATDKRMLKAIECIAYMHTNNGKELVLGPRGLYGLGLHATAVEYAMRLIRTGELNGALRKTINNDGKVLEEGYGTAGYTYLPSTGAGWDLSNTQYGILGLWACARANVELSEKTWKHFNNFILDQQSRDGGWGYRGDDKTKPTMTEAGLASLFVFLDLYHTRTRGANKPDISPFSNDPLLLRTVQGIERGLDNFGAVFKPNTSGYYMYGAERIGVASGYKYFGKHDWFMEGAEVLMRAQAANGSWGGGGGGPICQTPWNLMFLVFGSAPVLINKLQYGPKGDWTWHNYPRDAANIAGWYGRNFETLVNWQIIDLNTGKESDLLDAPILYISGYKDLTFKDDEVDVLRRYVDRGGTLLFVACGSKREFTDSVVKLGTRLYSAERFPEFQFTEVPKDHPVYTLQANANRMLTKIPLWHMHNGSRSFAFLIPEDINHLWHSNKVITRAEVFDLIANLKNYCTDKGLLPGKVRAGITYGEPKSSAKVGPIKLGVIAYTSKGVIKLQKQPGRGVAEPLAVKSDWASSPLTWRIYNEWFRHVAGGDVQEVRGVNLLDPELKTFDVLHLTGHYAFTLTPEEEKALGDYIRGGGTLLTDSIGGVNPDFHSSVVQLMRKMFPEKLETINKNHPLISGAGAAGRDVGEAEFTRAVKIQRSDIRNPAEVVKVVQLDGRLAVLACPFDLSLSLAGTACWEKLGFHARTARGLVANFLVLAKNGRKAGPVAAGAGAQ